eukprot:43897-Lingulodinium_polyedra.AAC.1
MQDGSQSRARFANEVAARCVPPLAREATRGVPRARVRRRAGRMPKNCSPQALKATEIPTGG